MLHLCVAELDCRYVKQLLTGPISSLKSVVRTMNLNIGSENGMADSILYSIQNPLPTIDRILPANLFPTIFDTSTALSGDHICWITTLNALEYHADLPIPSLSFGFSAHTWLLTRQSLIPSG